LAGETPCNNKTLKIVLGGCTVKVNLQDLWAHRTKCCCDSCSGTGFEPYWTIWYWF